MKSYIFKLFHLLCYCNVIVFNDGMISKNTIKYIRSLELKKNRTEDNVFVAEGPKVVAGLMEAFEPKMIIGTDEWFGSNNYTPKITDSVVSEEELRRVSFLQHPQQVLALFPIPQYNVDTEACSKELCLGLDGVQDPGNLGTIIRIADWFGISTIFCGTGTADAYSPKVVQATMGSIARVRLLYTDLHSLIERLPAETPVYGTALDGEDIYSTKLSPNGLIIMGNEGNGISPEVMAQVNSRLLIPKYGKSGGIDSLNVAVAAAVTCAEFRRRFR